MNGIWNRIPLFRYLLPFITGILISMHWHLHAAGWLFAFIAALIVLIIVQSVPFFSTSFRWQPLQGFGLQLVLVFAGICLTQTDTPLYNSRYFMQNADSLSVFYCRINHPPEYTEKTIRLYVDVMERIEGDDHCATIGKSIIYVRNDSTYLDSLQYGDLFFIKNNFQLPATPMNPGEFDFQRYLYNLKIYHTAFVRAGELHPTGENSARWIWQKIFSVKAYFIHEMELHLHNDNALSVGEALVIGQKSVIADDVQQAYSNTGTTHILAVSGLHVGILFIMLEFLFKPFPVFNNKRSWLFYFKTIFILIVIWLYTCLSGLSPSVNRSAVMFSFLTLGKMTNRSGNSFNVLLASMIPLLIDDPYQLLQVGFQLSYLAVGSIMFFQPYIAALWKPSHYILKQGWALVNVSLAAQIGTLPVTLYYFHQFPNYFLLSNIVAIPVSFAVLVLGILFCLVAAIPFIGVTIAWLFEWSLKILNGSVVAIGEWPGAVTQHIFITPGETICLFLVVIMIAYCLANMTLRYVNHALFFFWVMMISVAVRRLDVQHEHGLFVYHLKDHTAILVSSGTNGWLITDTDSLLRTDDYKYHIKGDLLRRGIHHPQLVNYTRHKTISNPQVGFYLHYPIINALGTTIFIADSASCRLTVARPETVDYVLLTGNPYLPYGSPVPLPHAQYLIGNSLSFRSARYWKKQLDQQKVPYFDLKSGPFRSLQPN